VFSRKTFQSVITAQLAEARAQVDELKEALKLAVGIFFKKK
jgi:hypothetical protein